VDIGLGPACIEYKLLACFLYPLAAGRWAAEHHFADLLIVELFSGIGAFGNHQRGGQRTF
jgi:hypothetical protein